MSIKNKVTLLLVLALLLAGCTPTPQKETVQQVQVVQEQELSIKTFGVGEVKVRPDTVRFEVVLVVENKELAPAEQELEEKTQNIIAVLKEFSIPNGDFKEDYPSLTTDAVGAKVYRYILKQDIKVTLRDLTQLEALFSRLLQIEATQISAIRFQIADLDLFKEQALTFAIADARKKAEVMAEELGQEVGKALVVEEIELDEDYQPSYPQTVYSGGAGMEPLFNQLNALSFNEITVHAKISVKFEIK
ncbi:MAG: SIMPL domain-containing protein [Chloroflexi bacterium]|nr:SIMPL domain-containing protein [Chloroflexota bacterium]